MEIGGGTLVNHQCRRGKCSATSEGSSHPLLIHDLDTGGFPPPVFFHDSNNAKQDAATRELANSELSLYFWAGAVHSESSSRCAMFDGRRTGKIPKQL